MEPFLNALTFPSCTAVLPEQDELHLGGGTLNDCRGVLVAPPIKNLVVNLKCRQRGGDELPDVHRC